MNAKLGIFRSLQVLGGYRQRMLEGVIHDVRQQYTGSVFGVLWLQVLGFTAILDLLDPFFCLLGQPIGTLLFVVCDIYVHTGNFLAVVFECVANHKLQCPHGVTMLSNKETVQLGGRNL